MKTVILALVALFFAGPSAAFDEKVYPNARQSYPFVVKVRDFYGAEGFGFDYYLDKSRLVIVLWDDLGSPEKEVLSRPLTKAEAREWAGYLERLPMEQLKEAYADPAVDDGLQQTFTFKWGGREKTVDVRNIRVEEFEKLCRKLNRLIPDKHMRLRIPPS
ncbi:hypothetical protein [Cystobacter ferrugineus]|uniref:Chalcone isomerase domain-containing protein n=1 Tax=Cystobacter ferrugineus TaxID=83449 RepID=A0A1L9BBJ8_9BACT|nr:hypothetical protein [Cystobacter ferrugineus]OJH39611.1 hypothetical protein BON30_19180 [Cystobacter ferrugineus]